LVATALDKAFAFEVCSLGGATRVARWFVFKPKIPNLGKFLMAFEW
jgi:hypothetical protein